MNSLARQIRTAADIAAPHPVRPPVRNIKPMLGNQSHLRQLQRKLTVGPATDPLEREADQIADQVMRMPAADISAGPLAISRKCATCEDEKVQTKRGGQTPTGNQAPASVSAVVNSPGQRLDGTTRAFFEPRFGRDFSDVRVHADAAAGESAMAIDANAYALRRDIVFAPGKYDPASRDGRTLLAHELAHVVQQTGGQTAGPDVVRRDEFAYGQANSCKAEHLPFIWQGQPLARQWAKAAIQATSGTPSADVVRNLNLYFGTDGAKPETVKKLNANFKSIDAALGTQYLYHCSKAGDTSDPEAEPCKTASGFPNAKTSQTGNRDVTLCFTDMNKWSVPFAAWVILHENVHRALGVWLDTYQAGDVTGCYTPKRGNPWPVQTDLALGAPDSYACFAISAAASAAAAAPAPAPTGAPGAGAPDAGAPPVRRMAQADAAGGAAPPSVDQAIRSTGQPLPSGARHFFEARFNRDFGHVQIHTGAAAAASARDIGARAYTAGSDLVFDTNQYAPESDAGRHLLAHELAHVVQQSRGEARIQRDGPAAGAPAPEPAHPNWTVLAPPPAVKQTHSTMTCWAAALSSWLGAKNIPVSTNDILLRYTTTSCVDEDNALLLATAEDVYAEWGAKFTLYNDTTTLTGAVVRDLLSKQGHLMIAQLGHPTGHVIVVYGSGFDQTGKPNPDYISVMDPWTGTYYNTRLARLDFPVEVGVPGPQVRDAACLKKKTETPP